MPIQFIQNSDVERLCDMSDVVSVIETAFAKHQRRRMEMPSKVYIDIPEHNGDFRAMPAYDHDSEFAGIKWVNSHDNNREKGLPAVMAMYILNDATTGKPLAVLEADKLTSIRTGAAGGVAAKHLSRGDSSHLVLIGAGEQAYWQALAIATVRDIEKVTVNDVSSESSSQLCAILEKQLKIPCETALFKDKALETADIVVTTTPVRTPIIKSEWVQPGTHINAIGADAEGKQEIEMVDIDNCIVIVDDMEQASHSGEVNVPISKGQMQQSDIFSNLGHVIDQDLTIRSSEEQITLFDSTGLAIQDLALAQFIYSKIVS